jgi:hypothetical protein
MTQAHHSNRPVASATLLALGLALTGCQSGDHPAKHPEAGPSIGTPLSAVNVYSRLPKPTGSAPPSIRVLPTPDGAHNYAIGSVPSARLQVTDATVRRAGPQWEVSVHVVDNPAMAAASMAGGRFAVLVAGKAVVPLLGIVENRTKLTGYGLLFGSNKAAAVAAAHEWTTSVAVGA